MTDKVLCPGCGEEMQIQGPFFYRKNYSGFFHCESCGWESPTGWGDTKKEAEENVRQAALRRYEPPIRPLAMEEVKEYVKGIEAAPVWMEDRNDALYTRWMTVPFLILIINEEKNNLAEYGKTWRCWPRKPTEEERKEAKWDDD